MSKKQQGKKQERLQQLSLFGKDLIRRCAARCELCSSGSVALSIYEVAPIPKEPEYQHCLMLCETCVQNLAQPKHMQIDHWRCLGTTLWSEVVAAKVTAVVLLNYLAEKHPWAQEYLEQAYLEDSEQAWVNNWQL